MMREVLMRRFKRLVLDEAEAAGDAAIATDGGTSSDEPVSRIEPPQPPPIDRRGGSALAFGVLRAQSDADADGARPAQAESAAAKGAVEEDADEVFPNRPDVVLVDGGLGQLGVAEQVLADAGVSDVALIAIAKGPDRDAGREHFHMPGRGKPMMLEPRDPVLYFVQRLRDEAHRFAIGAHRAKRSKSVGANPLDDIPGIGPGRKRALLKHFGSAKAVSRAGVDDLEAVDGISAQMAQTIYDFFHERHD